MKLSILLFVLAAIICGCQCAPNPGWKEDFDREMKNFHENLNGDLEAMHRQLEKERQEREEQFRREQEERIRHPNQETLEREEDMKQFREQMDRKREQGENMEHFRTKIEKKTSDSNTTVHVEQYMENGVQIYRRIMEKTNMNTVQKTIATYSSATNSTQIKVCFYDKTTSSDCSPDIMYN